VPPGTAGRVGIGVSFAMLRLRTGYLSDVAYLDPIGTALLVEDPDDLHRFQGRADRAAVRRAGAPMTWW
jgi:hypothetical protein